MMTYACYYCGSTDLVINDDGFLVCRRCGTVQPYYVEFAMFNSINLHVFQLKTKRNETLIDLLVDYVIRELRKNMKRVSRKTRARVENAIRYVVFNGKKLDTSTYYSLKLRFGIRDSEWKAIKSLEPIIEKTRLKATLL